MNWPDTPLKHRCDTTTCKDHYSPTFWSTKRLESVTTQVRNPAGGYDNVDRWTFGHEFPDPGDGEKAALWLRSITHTGLAAGGEISLPAVTFEGTQMANRVHKHDGAGWLFRYRITGIVSESGGVTTIDYEDPQCTGGAMPTNPESNSLRCFPVRWTPEGEAERTDDYFHKYVVARVVQSDRLSTSTQQVTSYDYLDGAAWHWDTSEFVKEDDKIWNESRDTGKSAVRPEPRCPVRRGDVVSFGERPRPGSPVIGERGDAILVGLRSARAHLAPWAAVRLRSCSHLCARSGGCRARARDGDRVCPSPGRLSPGRLGHLLALCEHFCVLSGPLDVVRRVGRVR